MCTVRVPTALFKAARAKLITNLQLQILTHMYAHAEPSDWRVRSYSVNVFCHAAGLVESDGSVGAALRKRAERAAGDLLHRKVITRNYFRGSKQCYDVWLPAPERLWDALSLNRQTGGYVADKISVNVDDANAVSDVKTATCSNGITDNVYDKPSSTSLLVIDTAIPNREKESPLPPEGVGSPATVLPFGSEQNALLAFRAVSRVEPVESTAAGKGNPLADPKSPAVIRLCAFLNKMSDPAVLGCKKSFQPIVEHVAARMDAGYSPVEIVCAYAKQFPDMVGTNASKTHFFARGVESVIDNIRLNQTENCIPGLYLILLAESSEFYQEQFEKAYDEWAKAVGLTVPAPPLFYDRARVAREAAEKQARLDEAQKKKAEAAAELARVKAEADRKNAERLSILDLCYRVRSSRRRARQIAAEKEAMDTKAVRLANILTPDEANSFIIERGLPSCVFPPDTFPQDTRVSIVAFSAASPDIPKDSLLSEIETWLRAHPESPAGERPEYMLMQFRAARAADAQRSETTP
jgi:hypothetical protein